jgi:hypothetical protein
LRRELATLGIEEYRRLRDGPRMETLKLVLELRLRGDTREEIAEGTG